MSSTQTFVDRRNRRLVSTACRADSSCYNDACYKRERRHLALSVWQKLFNTRFIVHDSWSGQWLNNLIEDTRKQACTHLLTSSAMYTLPVYLSKLRPLSRGHAANGNPKTANLKFVYVVRLISSCTCKVNECATQPRCSDGVDQYIRTYMYI